MKLNDLLSLQPGDLITTSKSCESEVFIQVEGRNKFFAHIGKMRGKRSVRITRITEQVIDTPPAPEKK
jgi:flagellar motor switch protein FliM